MIHCRGTRSLNTESRTAEPRVDTFLPTALLDEYPALSPIFAGLVRCFSDSVGTVTVERWDRAKAFYYNSAIHNPMISQTSSRR